MKKIIYFTAILLALLAGEKSVRAQSFPPVAYVWGSSPFQDSIWSIDTLTFDAVNRIAPSLSGAVVTGATGMAFDPCGLQTYIILKLAGVSGRVLATIDLSTGNCAQIGNLGDNFSSIVFDRNGQLFGLTGDGANVPETFFSIDKTTAVTSQLKTLGNGADGEILSYDPVNDMFYHWSGNNIVFYEKFPNTAPYPLTTIFTGATDGETFGALYLQPNQFLISNINTQFNYVDTVGNFSPQFGFNPDDLRGLVMPPVFASDVDTLCAANEVITIGAAAVNIFSVIYNWGDGVIDTVFSAGASHTYTAAGNYSLEVSLYNGYCAPKVYWTKSVVVINTPIVSLSGNTVICPNDSVTLVGSSGGSSQWYLDGVAVAGATNPVYSTATPGVYNMIKTNLNGCSDSAAVSLIVSNGNAPLVNLGNDTTVCGSVLLDAQNPGATYLWNTTDTTQVLLVNQSGNYYVDLTDTNGCFNSDSIFINVNALPIVTLSGNDTICAGDSTLLTGSVGGSSQWYFNGLAITGATSNSYYASAAGIYNMTKTNTNGCFDSSAVGITIEVSSFPVVTISGTDTICAGDSTLLSGSANGSSQWYFDGTAISGATGNTIYAAQAGLYNVIETNASGCADSSASGLFLVVNPKPIVTLSGDVSFCEGDSATLSGSSGGASQWYLDGSLLSGATSNTLVVYVGGSYNMTKTNTNGCSDSSGVGIVVTVNSLPLVSYVELQDTVCVSQSSITLSPGSPAGGTYTGNQVSGNLFNPSSAGIGLTTIVYSYTDSLGCASSDTSQIYVDPCSGLNDLSQNDVFNVFPNPSTGVLNIHMKLDPKEEIEVSVYTARGEMVYGRKETGRSFVIDLTAFESGVYYVQLTTNGKSVRSKVTLLY